MSRIFLTGGTGSIGSAVLAAAVAAGHTVTALTRSAASAHRVKDAGAQAFQGDVADPDGFMHVAAESDAFIHLAASFDAEMAQTEPRLLDALFKATAARSTPLRFLYTGGCWMYGQTGNAVAEERSPLTPIAAFAWAEDAITSLADRPGLSTAVIHPAMVYDTRDGGVFDRMIRALRAGRPAPIWGSEHTRWPLIHSADAATGYLCLIDRPQATGAFNLVTETGVPVGEIARVLAEQAGIKTPPAVLPRKWALRQHGEMAEGPMLDQQMRSTRMGDLGWVPAYPDFSVLNYPF